MYLYFIVMVLGDRRSGDGDFLPHGKMEREGVELALNDRRAVFDCPSIIFTRSVALVVFERRKDDFKK